jgi:hypothetical protein
VHHRRFSLMMYTLNPYLYTKMTQNFQYAPDSDNKKTIKRKTNVGTKQQNPPSRATKVD